MNEANRQVGTRSLSAVVPDYESLLADPAGYLKRGELRIGTRRVPWWMFLLPPAFFGLGLYLIPASVGLTLATISPVFLGALIYWAWPVQYELILRADGAEFVGRYDAVRCPWPLFDATGQAVVRTSHLLDVEIAMPIRRDAVRLVEYVLNGLVIGTGRYVTSNQFWFHSDDEVCIASVYAMRPQDLGNLLLQVGRILGRPSTDQVESFTERKPQTTAITAVAPDAVIRPATALSLNRTTEPPETDSVDIKRFPSADRNGWITIPVTQLSFAPLCCECCSPTINRYYVQIDEGFQWLMLVPLLGRIRREKVLDVLVPLCPRCRLKDVAWQIALSALGLGLGFAPLGILALIAFAGLNVGLGQVLFVLALFLAPFSLQIRRNPFQARYSESARTVSLRFRAGVPAEKILS